MNKNSRITFRLSENQHTDFKNLAAKYDLSISDFIVRSCLLHHKLNLPERKTDLKNCIHELHKAGNNLNQIAKSLNILVLNQHPEGIAVTEIKDSLSDLRRAIKKLEGEL
jgi:hypothetical protein